MSDKCPPRLHIISNEDRPFVTDLTSRETHLTIRTGGRDLNDAITDIPKTPPSGDSVRLAFETVEASLRAENWNIETVRAE